MDDINLEYYFDYNENRICLTSKVYKNEAEEDENENDKSTIYADIDAKNGQISDAVTVEKGKRIAKELNPNTGNALPTEVPYWEEIILAQ